LFSQARGEFGSIRYGALCRQCGVEVNRSREGRFGRSSAQKYQSRYNSLSLSLLEYIVRDGNGLKSALRNMANWVGHRYDEYGEDTPYGVTPSFYDTSLS
jgi:hypothetical protein